MISCDHCGIVFKYNCHLEKHLSRKFPCFSKHPSENTICQEINDGNKKLRENSKILRDNETIIGGEHDENSKKYKCDKCSKFLSSKSYLKKHQAICNGLNSLQCPICFKFFSSASTKSEHKRNVKCKPPEEAQNMQPQNVTINNNINITNNVQIVNWSNENYEHMTPEAIANIIRKCMRDNKPLTFFSEFPTAAHQGAHSNIKLTNLRANYIDIYKDGRFFKLQADDLIYDCTKKMIYRLDDAFMENEQAFKNVDKIARSLVRMEEVVDGIPKGEASEAQLNAMQHLNVTGRSDIMSHVKNGIRNAYILSK